MSSKPKQTHGTGGSEKTVKVGKTHRVRDCKARVIRAPDQEGEEESKADSGELYNLKANGYFCL